MQWIMSDVSMSAERSNEVTQLRWNSYLILNLVRKSQFIDIARALAIVLSPFFANSSTKVVKFLLTFKRCGNDATMWQRSAKLFYFLSSHVSALLHIVMSLFANFLFFFANEWRKKEMYIYKKRLFVTNLVVSMHRRTCYRFNKMPSLSSGVLWPIVICAADVLSILFVLCECIGD